MNNLNKLYTFTFYTLWTIMLFSSMILTCSFFTERIIAPKWYIGGITSCLFIILYLIGIGNNHKQQRHISLYPLILVCLIIVSIECLWFIVYKTNLLLHSNAIPSFNYDNTAGLNACIIPAIPLALFLIKSHYHKQLSILFLVLLVITTILSNSRLAWICIIMSFAITFSPKRLVPISLIVILITIILTFTYKTNSSKGRFFIYQRTFEMIKEKPITGWGHNGFRKNYMIFQAKYFKTHHNIDNELLADTIRHPLSEFLLIAVNYGVIAAIIVIFAIIAIFWYINKNLNSSSYLGGLILANLFILSLFSYPLTYFISWLYLFFSIYIVFAPSINFIVNKIKYFLIVACAICMICITENLQKELEWGKATNFAMKGNRDKATNLYRHLSSWGKENPFFIYNFASLEYGNGNYDEAVILARECQKLISDYDLELLLGDIYFSKSMYKESFKHYQLAHFMVPNRLAPLYGMYQIAKNTNNLVLEKRIRIIVRHFNIKIKSKETLFYLHLMET